MVAVAVLFAREDSIYKSNPAADVEHIRRDARHYYGGLPVVAHPPCRMWGKLSAFAKPRPDERELGLYAVDMVRGWGGVLEHPRGSALWAARGMPEPLEGRDAWGGYTIAVNQHWWGHRAEKATWLYIVGCPLALLPPIPVVVGEPTHVIATCKRLRFGDPGFRSSVTHREREATPPALADWLIAVAQLCGRFRHA